MEGGREDVPSVLSGETARIDEVLVVPEEEGAFGDLEVVRTQALGNEAEEGLADLWGGRAGGREGDAI